MIFLQPSIHPSLKVLLVEDDWAERSAVRGFLERHGMQVTDAGSLGGAMQNAVQFSPDVAVLDIVLPAQDGQSTDYSEDTGISLARRLRELFPQVGIVFLSAYIDRGPEVVQLFMEGHQRIVYLLKGSPPDDLLQAVRKVAGGRSALEIASGVQTQRQTPVQVAIKALSPSERPLVLEALRGLDDLTESEKRVFIAIGQSATRQQAAQATGISEKTISSHMETIYAKLHLREGENNLNPLAMLAKVYLIYALDKEA